MKEHYVSYDCAKRLHELGFDGIDKYYVTESFCRGGDPDDYYAKGMLVDEYIVYFVNDNNEDDFRGVPAPRLDQAAAWLREVKGIYVYPEINCLKKWFAKGVDMERNEDLIWDGSMFDTYEQAMSYSIDAALELLTNKP